MAVSDSVLTVAPGSALGVVETHGLVAAVEAADAMLKAADVRLVRKHRVDPGMISNIVVGETSAVQAAVDAGVAAAARIGRVAGSLVIPRPSDDVWRAMLGVSLGTAAAPRLSAVRTPPSDVSPSDAPSEASGAAPGTAPPERDYDAMTVRDLRTLARDRPELDLVGRAVAAASKDELVAALRAADAR